MLVGFNSNDRLLSRLIGFFRHMAVGDKGWCTHSFLIYDIDGVLSTIDADIWGVEINPLFGPMGMELPKYNLEIWEIPDEMIDLEKFEKTKKFMLEEVVGQPYGYAQLIGMTLVSIEEKFGVHAKNFFHDNWICSEVTSQGIIGSLKEHSELFKTLSEIDRDSIAPDGVLIEIEKAHCKCVAVKPFGKTKIEWLNVPKFVFRNEQNKRLFWNA